MTKLMTAEEARKISKSNSEEDIIIEILNKIKQKAEEGEFQLNVVNFGFGDGAYYSNGLTDKQKRIVDKLKELNYETRMIVEERQFVNIYLRITWK